ncbi:hypothetical protein GCM10007860_25220 [Chitiniphilus shinanonensis]|uniref:Uncharacterized protein n=1 Tax=Chitiniphilus shinanonensis TaxID=553088 RepID=A0ABQ6BTM9_9NEIS|nr:hypothetical protein GCM10007860_25220 [Chitiniphilus shinanonensis]
MGAGASGMMSGGRQARAGAAHSVPASIARPRARDGACIGTLLQSNDYADSMALPALSIGMALKEVNKYQ